MSKTLLRAGALACALMATTALTAPALAQDTSDLPPPNSATGSTGTASIWRAAPSSWT